MIEKRFLKDNLIFATSTVVGGLLGYFFHFVIARKLSVSEYGELQAITSLSIFFGVLASALSFFVIKYSSILAAHQDRKGQLHFIIFLIQKFKIPIAGLLLLYIALLPLLERILHLTDYFGLIAIGLSIIFSVYLSIYTNALQGWKKFSIVCLIGVSASFIKLVSGYFLASFFPTASLVSFSILLSVFLGWLLAKFFARREWPASASPTEEHKWREIHFEKENFKKSFANILLFSLMLVAVSNLDIVLIKSLASSEITGFYAALSVLGKIILWVNLSVLAVLLPDALSLGHEDKPVDRKAILGSYGLIFFISVAALIVYYFFPVFLVNLLFGGKYVDIAESLWLFGLMAVFLSLLTFEANLALARRDFRVIYFLGVVAIILASAIFLHHTDLRGIVISVMFSFLLGWIAILALNLNHRFTLRETI